MWQLVEKDKMLLGQYDDPRDAKLVELRFNARLVTKKFNQSDVYEQDHRIPIIKSLFGATGEGIHLDEYLFV
jgi:maltose O-acetyltransferase